MSEKSNVLVITLRAARTNAGYTLDDVSKCTPYSRDQIHKMEQDSRNISYAMLENLIQLYQVPLKHIFLGIESDFIGKLRVSEKVIS